MSKEKLDTKSNQGIYLTLIPEILIPKNLYISNIYLPLQSHFKKKFKLKAVYSRSFFENRNSHLLAFNCVAAC